MRIKAAGLLVSFTYVCECYAVRLPVKPRTSTPYSMAESTDRKHGFGGGFVHRLLNSERRLASAVDMRLTQTVCNGNEL